MEISKAQKYLKYSIGETILVVVGILIALSVNNWNETRQTKREEIKLLVELKENLLETKVDLLTDIKKADQILSTSNSLYLAISKNQISATTPFELSTGYLLDTSVLFPKLSAYKAIQSKGITIISNDALRKKITDFYELHLRRISDAEDFLKELDNHFLKPYLNSVSKPKSSCAECSDLNALIGSSKASANNQYLLVKADDQLIHIIKERYVVFSTLKQRYTALGSLIDELISDIEQET